MHHQDHEHPELDAAKPTTRSADDADPHQLQAAAAGRADVLGPPGLLGVQRAAGNSAASRVVHDQHDDGAVHDVISSDGDQIADDVRIDMESRMGHDFSDVRVHTDDAADRSARSVSAHAYTVGSDIVFRRGAYDPGSTAGQTRLAHELTHVVQQRSGPVDGTPIGNGVSVSDPSDRFERAASANAERVMSQPTPVQRQEDDEEEEDVQTSHDDSLGHIQRQEDEEENQDDVAVQRESTPTYDEQADPVSGQRPGQSREERVGEMAGELAAETRQGAAAARGEWDREMAIFESNIEAVYTKMEVAHRVASEALHEAWENHNGVLNEIDKARQMRAAVAGAVIGIGLSVISAGAGSLAGAAMGRVAGRFANATTHARAHTAISEMLVESLKQGIQTGGGAILKPNVDTPTNLGDVDSPREFKDKGILAIRSELADMRNIIRWLEIHRDQLQEPVLTDTQCLPGNTPIVWVDRHAREWGEMLAGAEGMESAADTKQMEIEIWKPWIEKNGATTTSGGMYSPRRRVLDPDVKKYVVKHVRDHLGVSEAQVRSWAGLA